MNKYRYKVIKKKTRTSAMVNGNSKYCLKYEPGEDVFALPDTLGIFVFTNKTYAERWVELWGINTGLSDTKHLTVVRVIPIGRGKRVEVIANDITSSELDRFYKDLPHLIYFPPDHTICYKGVHVVE